MKQFLLSFLVAFILLLGGRTSKAQTTLTAGDIAFIGLYQSDASTADAFTFITLKALAEGTVIYFTDDGWNNGSWGGTTSEVHFTWSPPAGGSPIGTIVTITYGTPSIGICSALTSRSGTPTWFYGTGEEVLAYQSSTGAFPASPTFIAGIMAYYTGTNYDATTKWFTSIPPSNTQQASTLPDGLTNGTNCVSVLNANYPTAYKNCRYTGTLTGTASAVRALINSDANWTRSNTTPYDITSAAFSAPSITADIPTVTGISPSSGTTAGGTSVTITGTNLTGASAVKFGATNATSYTVNSGTQITATSPAGSAGTVDVTVTTTGGMSATSASDQFTYIAPPSATTNAATSVTSTGATLNGSINANNASTTVTFEYGLTTGYGTSVTADQSPVTGSSATSASNAITGLSASTTYHFRVKGVNSGGTTNGSDQTFTTLAAGPTATAPSGTGTSGDQYIIATLENLYWVAVQTNSGNTFSGKYFIQTADIDASATSTWFSGQGWMPIGYASDNGFTTVYTFSGNYDGQNHVVSNLYINRTVINGYGLFGCVDYSTIKNLGVTNISITATGANDMYAGGLIGYANAGNTIENCYSTGTVTCRWSPGGLIGTIVDETYPNTVLGCHSECNVTATYWVAGGLVAESYGGTITNCYSTGSVTGQGSCSYIGGLIGNNVTAISKCYSSSTVTGGTGQSIGGLLGDDYGNISNCYATGSVTTSGINVGGLIGRHSAYYGGIISNCYAKGAVSGSTGVGGLIGSNTGTPSSNVTNSFWDTQTSLQSSSAGGGTGKNTTEMKTVATFTGASWSTSVWALFADGVYPKFLWELPTVTTTAVTTYDASSATMGGNVTAGGTATVTERGVVYSTTDSTPTIGESGVTKDTNGTGLGSFSESIGSLTSGTLYYVNAYATNSAGTSYGTVTSFTTTATAPTVSGISPTSGSTAGGTSVVITGTNLTGATAVSFGGTAATGYTVNSATQITATSPAKSAGTIDVTVTTSGGTSATSASDQFTYIAAPSATTNAATSVTSTGATLNGSINANNANTTVTFEYGLTTGYGTSVTAVESPVSGSSATFVSKAITGLSASTTYHFRVKGVNAGGTTNGSDQTFTTSAAGPTIAYGVNLVLNGDAETNSLANWTNSGPVFVALSPSGSGVSNSPSGGYAFDYYPGSASGNESLSQIIDITSLATDIDAGIVKAVLSGEVKKFYAASNCILRVQELDASNALLHTSEVDGITSGDVWLTGNVSVANLNTNTRKLKVILYAQVSTNTDDYIEFDNIQLVLFRPPTLTTTTVSTYSATSATLGGNVTANGGTAVTERGVVYSTTDANPTIGESGVTKVTIGSGTGSFSQSVGSLTSGSLYYVNAFATNSAGTSYGTVTSFTTTAAAPTVSSVSVPSDATYIAGQNLDFTVNYSEAITVTGTPYIPITLNTGGTVNASYVSGSGTTALVFRYTVASGNLDNDGVSVGTAITANGGTLKNGSSTDANLTLNSIGNTTGVLIDAVAPTISSVSSTTANGIYINGDVISITVTFSEAVTVTGTPTLALNSGGTASYFSGSGTTTLTFTYTVGSSESSADLDYIATNSLALSGGTIKDAAGNDATLTLPPVGGASSLGGQKDIVIGIVPIITTQAVSSITSTSATGNGNITDLGYPNPSAYGICWNTTGTPTTADNKVDKGAASATGAFTGSITGLLANTTYYVRAYATNDVETVYGNEVTFTTLQSSNLLENPGAELDYTSWTRTDGGSGWGIDGSPYSGSKDWASSYRTCTLSQTVDLIAKGYAAADLDLSIPIYAKAYVATNSFMGGQATVKVELLNASDGVMNTYYVCNENLATNLPWTKKETLISGYSSGLRKVRYTISGVSNTSWAGQYGPRFDETELSFKKVTTKPATQLELTSATLNSTVFTLGLSSTVKFEYGTTSGVYTESVDVTDISGTSANVNVSGLNQGTTYYVRAVMTNSAGTFYGDQISFRTKIPLTIGNPVISSKEYDGNTTATVSTLGTLSGIEGTDEVSVSPTAVFDTKDVGSTVTVTVSYTLNGTNKDKYEAPVNSVVYTGEITKAMLTVTADDQSKVYGDANPTLTFQYSGWKNGEGESVIDTKPTASTTVDLLSNVGTHTNSITVSGGIDNNYSFAYVPANLTVTTSTITVTADAKSKVYGDANPTLTFQYSGWKNGEGESVIDTKPTTSTTVDLLSNVGTHTNSITVSGGIDNNYSFAYVPADFTITASTLTVTADAKSKVYGNANPTLTFQYSGWKNSDTETVLDIKPTTSTTVDLLSNVGTYTNSITVSGGADNNYSFTYVPANLTVTTSTLTVTADAKSKVYGNANPTLTFQYSGWKNSDTETVLDIKPTTSTTVDLLSNVGTYTNSITVSGGADNNYSFTYVPANLTVTTSTLTVTADAKSKVYGNANPTLTFQYSGWKNGEGESVIDTRPTASTTVDLFSNVGTYTNSISVSGGIDNNYSFAYVPANFTVTASTLTVTADAQTKVYGDANPTLTFQYSGWKNSDTEIVLDTKPTASTTVDLLSNVGTHTNSITVSGGADNNYSFTYVPANLTVTTSTLTVTADAQTKVYGASNPTLTFVYSGWKNSDDETVLDTKPTASTTVNLLTNVGTHTNAITVSAGVDNNYAFNYVPANFTVTKATLTATADGQTKVYGDANPTLTFAYSGWKNSDTETVLDTKPTASTTVDLLSTVGTYTNVITMSGGVDNNYAFTYLPADFSVTASTLTVTADAKSKVYGDANPTLTFQYSGWKNGEGESVIDTKPTASTTVDLLSNVGTHTNSITVSGGADNNYSFTYVPANLTVTTSTLTVTADAKSKVYGDANPTLTFQYSGWKNGEGESVIDTKPTASTTVDLLSNVGTYTNSISVSGGIDNNYSFTYVPANFTVTASTLTVTANVQSKVYGDANPTLTFQYSGWKNGEGESVIDTKPTASTTVGLLSNVGTYTNVIMVSGGIDNNYSFTYVPANFTVTASTLTVTANVQSKVYGDANPTLTFQYSGWKNGEGESVIDTKPTASTTVGLLSNVGTYTNVIMVSGGIDNNYSFTYVPANFTVTASTLTVTADAKSKVYGDANPTLTFQYSGWKNGEGESVIDTKPTASTTVSITTTTGTYPNAITVSGGLDNNYDFTYVSASFTVGKGKLIAWLDPKTKEYGQENPVLTYRYAGFMNDDDESTLDSKPHPTTKVTKSTDAGTYTNSISMVGGLDDKYNIFDVPANFTVTKANQFITFNTLAPKTYGDSSFNLDATTNSGLTLSYTCSNTDVAVVSGSTVSITGAGTAMITVSQPGNNNYLASETVSQTLTVNKKLLFVEGIAAESKVYDGNANAVLTGGTLTGTVDSDVIMVSIATTGTFSQTSVGTAIPVSTSMTISGENAANYVLSSPILRADIIAKTVTVTAQNEGRVCDEQEQVLTYTFEPALIDGDTFTGKLARTAGTAPGVYPISQGNLSLGTNYTINFIGAAYTIANAKNLAPVVDLVNDLKVSKNSKEATVILTGIDPVSNCIAQEIESIIATAENTTLIPEVQVDYIKGLSTAKLKIKIADELTGETTIRVKLKDNGGTGNGGVDTKELSFTIKVEISTGVDDLNQGVEAIIYPNPSNGLIHIETSGFVNPFVRIFKVTGEEILKKTNLTELVQAINLKGNSPGLYFVEIGDKQKNVTKKLIIKK